MSPRLQFFGLGLVLGVLLAGPIAWLFPRDKQTVAIAAIHSATSAPGHNTATVSFQAFDWRTVESDDYRKYIANLRAIGCPEQTIRDIIIADVNELFEDRQSSLMGDNTNRHAYWKSWAKRNALVMDEGRIKQQQQLARDKQAVIKELLGIDWEETPEMPFARAWNDQLDFLDSNKRSAVLELEQQFAARSSKLVLNNQGTRGLEELDRARNASIAALLTPEEFEEYRLRRSPLAGKLSSELETFDPTEQEFREIFRVYSQIEGEFGVARNGNFGSVATASLEERLKGLLGDARYADYTRSQDSSYRTAYRIAETHGFGLAAANQVFEIRKSAQERARPVEQDYRLSKEQRRAALSSIRAEADRAAHAVFSHEAMLALEGQGAWLGHIAPPATPGQRE